MRALPAHQSPLGDLRIEKADTPFQPGDLLRGSFCIHDEYSEEIRSAELSVLWYTAGKGEEDFGVHFFKRYSAEGAEGVELTRRREFRTLLPDSPLSYDGLIVKVCWCARLRMFLARGRQQVLEASFQLGSVAVPQLATVVPSGQDEA